MAPPRYVTDLDYGNICSGADGCRRCLQRNHRRRDDKILPPATGEIQRDNLKNAQELGYKTFFWSLAYVDWYEDDQPTKEEAFSKLLGRIHPGAIVLLHNTSNTNAEILDELLGKWKEMGYQIRPLTELAQ